MKSKILLLLLSGFVAGLVFAGEDTRRLKRNEAEQEGQTKRQANNRLDQAYLRAVCLVNPNDLSTQIDLMRRGGAPSQRGVAGRRQRCSACRRVMNSCVVS